MKRTDLERKERELRRRKKKDEIQSKRGGSDLLSVGDYINSLFGLFFFDSKKIYNTLDSEEILELIENMKANIEEKQWENVLRKAIRKTKVQEKDKAFSDLNSLI